MHVTLPFQWGSGARTEDTETILVNRRAALWACIGLLILGAFSLRMYGVSARTFWQDEGLTLYQIGLSLTQVLAGGIEVQGVMTQNTHPPLYFLLLTIFSRLAGDSQLAVRWFSIAWSLLTIPAMYVLGRRLASPLVGGIAALLVSVSPLYLWYAQEVRMYSMVVCLSTLSTYAFWRAITERNWRTFGLYVLVTIALMLTHYSAWFFVAAQAGLFVVFLGRRRPKFVVAGAAIGLSVAAPFLPFIWRRLQVGKERNYAFVELDTIAQDLLHSFTSGVTMPIEGIWYFDLLVLAVVLVGTVWLWRSRRLRAAITPIVLLTLPVLLLYTATYIKPMYQNVRHLIVVSPLFYVLAGAGLAGLARLRAHGRRAGVILSVALFMGWSLVLGISTYNYFNAPQYQKDDTRSLFTYIAEHFRPGDIVVLSDAVYSHLLEYEQPQLPWVALPHYATNAQEQPEAARRQYEQTVASAERVWLIYSPFDIIHDPQQVVEEWFREEAFPLDVQRFHGTTTELGVIYYDPHGAVSDSPQQVTQEIGVSLANGVDLHGARVPATTISAGGTLFFDLVWHVRQQPENDFKVSIRLRGPNGRVWAARDHVPLPQVHSPLNWIAGDYIRSPHELDVPAGTPPGTYDVQLAYYDAVTGASLLSGDGSEFVLLGQFTVQPGTVPAEWQPPQQRSAQIGTSWQLHGVDVPDTVRVGNAVPVEVFVSAREPASAYPDVRLELVNEDNSVVAQHEEHLITTEFDGEVAADTLLRHRQTLVVPPLAEPGTYAIRAVFLDDAGQPLTATRWWGLRSKPFVTLGEVAVEDRPRQFEVPADVHNATQPVGADWVQGVTLARASVPVTAAAGEDVPLTFVWEAAGPTDRSYKLFVHLRDEANDVVAQADAYPAGGRAPTNGWADGEVIVDERTLSLPTNVPAGEYRLVIGFYDEESGHRLPRAGEQGDEYSVDTLEVRSP